MTRELSDGSIADQARALRDYLAKPGNRGASFWLDSKNLRFDDRAAVLSALHDLEAE